MSHTPFPLPVVRTVALHAQSLTTPNHSDAPPTPDRIYDLVEQLGCVQIDTLHMVRRAQYVTLWSRLGHYDPADFDRLIYDPAQRRLFEYWQHAASIIPLRDYRYALPKMQHYRNGGGWWPDWSHQPENIALVENVRERIRTEGGVRSSHFESSDGKRGSWWDWKPAKHALEYLYNTGEVMIADRANFQRVYDLRERVLPAWVDTREPSEDEARRYQVERAARALGIGDANHIADYAYMKRRETAATVAALVHEGTLIEREAEVVGGETRTLILHRDTLPVVEQAADGAITAARTTFFNPFDSLFWAKGRDERLWGFRQALEAYLPAPKRRWGYYCLPILHHDRLVGRFDPKLDRKTNTLILRALYLEPGIELAEDLVADVAAALRDFMAWHNATDVVVERSDPAEFGAKLLAAL
ncbi:MAG: winged helix-turn-helix domain-containing protein [Chloroflexi bacterium]|nr:MAG: winged helix-turn-helix domain-containing protein [Chloroflexota bacterium]